MDSNKRVVQVQSFLQERIEDVIRLETEAAVAAENDKSLTTTYAWAGDTPRHLIRRTNAYSRYRKRRRPKRRRNQEEVLPKDDSTHSWSVKRMKMSNTFWGSDEVQEPIALQPCAQGKRFMLNRSVHVCTVHDMSYQAVLEVSSDAHNELVTVLQSVVSPAERVTVTSDLKVSTSRAIRINMLYRYGSFPYGSLGPARLIWGNKGKKLYLLVHGLIKRGLVSSLDEAGRALCDSSSKFSVQDISSSLTTFRLSGKQSAATLQRCLGSVLKDSAGRQSQVLRLCGLLPPNITFGLDLQIAELCQSEKVGEVSDVVEGSRAVSACAELLKTWIPGSFDLLKGSSQETNATSVHAMFLKRDGIDGYDIVFPTMSQQPLARRFFQKLVFCGASPSGVENEHHAATHAGHRFFPIDFPDTFGGRLYWDKEAKLELARLERLPLSKVGKSLRQLNADGVVPRWEKLFTSKNETTVVVKYSRFVLQQNDNAVELYPIVLALCHHQPKGVKCRLETNAQIYAADEASYQAWTSNPRAWAGVNSEELKLIGFVTSSAGHGRLVGSSMLRGLACIRLDNIGKGQQRLLRGRDLFVLVRNPSCSTSAPCIAAFARIANA